jgi:hypothetical protein
MITITMCSCINIPERESYLKQSIESIREVFPDNEFIIAFDKNTGLNLHEELGNNYNCKCYTHDNGMGHSFNLAIENASNDFILQTEDDWVIRYGQKLMPDKKSFIEQVESRIMIVRDFGGIFRLDNMTHDWWKAGNKEMEYAGYNFRELNKPRNNPNPNTSYDAYFYSNHPQIKHKDLHKKIGWYKEKAPPNEVEVDMMAKYLKSDQRVFFSPYNTFVHIGSASARNS